MVGLGDTDLFRYERCSVTPACDDFPDDGTADVRQFRLSDQEHRLNPATYDVIEL